MVFQVVPVEVVVKITMLVEHSPVDQVILPQLLQVKEITVEAGHAAAAQIIMRVAVAEQEQLDLTQQQARMLQEQVVQELFLLFLEHLIHTQVAAAVDKQQVAVELVVTVVLVGAAVVQVVPEELVGLVGLQMVAQEQLEAMLQVVTEELIPAAVVAVELILLAPEEMAVQE